MTKKNRFLMLEKVMTLVFRVIDALSENKKAEVKQTGFVKTIHAKSKKVSAKSTLKKTNSFEQVQVTKQLKTVPSGKKIQSVLASQMLLNLKNQKLKPISETAQIEGKKSLAWVVWALSVAEKSHMQSGISIHDVSSFLYHAAKIEIYPINVSRMVHDHGQYIKQVSQEKKTKRYLLTDAGRRLISSERLM